MKFSPDGRYFVAGSYGAHFAWNLSERRELSLPGAIKNIVKASFAFIASDLIIGIETASPKKSPMLSFPSGERLGQVALAIGIDVTAATDSGYMFVGPLKDRPLGLFDLKKGTIPIKFNQPAADVYQGTMVTEQVSGELALHPLNNLSNESKALAIVKLPQAHLAPLRAAAISPDFNWMAMSQSTRGAVWDVRNNIRTMELSSFHGVWFAPDQFVYVDLSKSLEAERGIARLDPMWGRGTLAYKIGDVTATQYGPYLVVSRARTTTKTNGATFIPAEYSCFQLLLERFLGTSRVSEHDKDVELRDVRDGHLVWSHYFPREVPALSFESGSVLLRWSLNSTAGREELGKFPELKNGTVETDYLLEKIDLGTDSVAGKVIVKTNKRSFAIDRAFSQGDWIIVSATGNQVLTYSMVSGQEKGHFFGTNPAAAKNGLLALEKESGKLSIYDMVSSQLKKEYTFADPIAFKSFSPDGDRLFVVTTSQTAYIVDLMAKN